MSINKLQTCVELMMECGFSLRKISEEIGKNSSYFSHIKTRGYGINDAILEDVRRAFRKRGLLLSRFSPEELAFADLYDKASLRVGKLADRIGVSRQAINSGQMSEEKIHKLTREINKLGETLIRLTQ